MRNWVGLFALCVSLCFGSCGTAVNDVDADTVTSVTFDTMVISTTAMDSNVIDTCTLKIHTTYGGTGIAGQDLGSGSFDEEFEIVKGDVIYETFGGRYVLDRDITESNTNFAEVRTDCQVFEIKEITSDFVVIDGVQRTNYECSFEEEIPMYSLVHVADGINYSHTIKFTK